MSDPVATPAATPAVPVPPAVHVGVDVCKRRLDAFVLPTGQTLAVDNTDEGVAQLVAVLKQQPGGVALVLLEATGRHERRCADGRGF